MPDEILSQCRDSTLAFDGNACNDPRNGNIELPYVNTGNSDREDHRLASFTKFPQNPDSALPRNLAQAGFYFTGIRDVVKCFSCGRCVEHMLRSDNLQDRRFHEDDCLHCTGNDPHNITTDHPPTAGPLQEYFRNGEWNPSSSNTNPSPAQSESNEMTESNPEPQEVIPQQPTEPTSDNDQNQNMEAQPMVVETPATGAANTSTDLFPELACLDPFHSHFADVRARLRTFQPNWHADIQATPQSIAEAGFFYNNDRDSVTCWYCNGRLENWERDDDPWLEHAKWFPQCEFLLRNKGPDFVEDVISQLPNQQAQQPTMTINPLPNYNPDPAPNPALAPPRPTNTGPQTPLGPIIPLGPQNFPGLQNTPSTQIIRTRRGTTLINISGGQYVQGFPGNININDNNGNTGRVTINIRGTGGSAGRTIVHGGSGVNIIQGSGRRSGRRQPRQPPQFVDPAQDAERHKQTVDETMLNSPLVADARGMGFNDEIIRIVLLSKFRAGGRMYENTADFVEALTVYQGEAARLEENEENEPGTSQGPQLPQEGATGASGSGEEQGPSSSSETQLRHLEESRNCKMCHREMATVVVMPCAHLALCNNCAARNIRVCPVCKQMVTENIRSFIA